MKKQTEPHKSTSLFALAYTAGRNTSAPELSHGERKEVTHDIFPPTQNQDVSMYHTDLQSFVRGRGGFGFWLKFFLGRLGRYSLFLTLPLPLGIGVDLRTGFGFGILLRLSLSPALGLLLSSPRLIYRSWGSYVLTDWKVGLSAHSRGGFRRIGEAPLQFELHISTKAENEHGPILRGYESTLIKQHRLGAGVEARE